MNYNLTNCTQRDYEIIYKFKKNSIIKYIEEIWGWNEEYQRSDFSSTFNHSDFTKIMVDNECIGFYQLESNDKNINITEIHIIPNYQGFGIGTSILKALITESKNTNRTISLGCFKINSNAIKLYKKLDFKIVDETKTHYLMKQ